MFYDLLTIMGVWFSMASVAATGLPGSGAIVVTIGNSGAVEVTGNSAAVAVTAGHSATVVVTPE